MTVSISVDSSAVGGPVSGSGTFTFEEGATVYDALCALGLSIGSQDSIHGVYVSSINGLAEKEHGASSGWMYAVNGKLPNMACSAYKLVDGDYSIHGVYVSSINGLAEKEHGASSGWMYAVNGKLPNMACSAYKLVDGDSIQWRYVTG